MTTPSRVSLPSLPAQTPPPQLPPSAFSKRRRQHPDRRSMYNLVDRPSDPYIVTRDVIADESQVGTSIPFPYTSHSPHLPCQCLVILTRAYLFTRSTSHHLSEEAQSQCQVFSNNAVFSCFPTNTTSIPQHQIASFVCASLSPLSLRPLTAHIFLPFNHTGNSNLPYFTQTNLVNIYLLDASDNQVLKTWLEQPNPSGRPGVLRTPVNDTWLGSRGSQWSGKNMTFLYYFVVTRNDVPLESGIPQPIFTAVREYYYPRASPHQLKQSTV